MSDSWFRRPGLWMAAGAALLGALLVWGFLEGREEAARERERERPVKAPSRVSVEGEEVIVTVDADTQARAEIDLEPLRAVTAHRSIAAYGTIVDAGKLSAAQTSYEAARAQAEKAGASLEASRREYERVRSLHRVGQNVSAKVLEAAVAAFRGDDAVSRAATVTLGGARAATEQAWGPVIAQWIFEGSPELGRLLSREELLIQVALPPGEPIAAPPERARVRGASGASSQTRLVSAAPRSDPRIQGLTLFYRGAPSNDLLPGMSVVADLPIGEETTGLVLPRSAVVWFQAAAWAYFEKAPTKLARRRIATDFPVDDGYLVPGLRAGSRAVVRGAQLLLSEEARAEIQVGEESAR